MLLLDYSLKFSLLDELKQRALSRSVPVWYAQRLSEAGFLIAQTLNFWNADTLKKLLRSILVNGVRLHVHLRDH